MQRRDLDKNYLKTYRAKKEEVWRLVTQAQKQKMSLVGESEEEDDEDDPSSSVAERTIDLHDMEMVDTL